MPYIVDGHNLIPNISGIQLQDIDDEERLIEKLQAFSYRSHKQIEVYFDRASPGSARRQSAGLLTVVFVREGSTADQAIHTRLKTLHKEAPNWTVVSSDQRVQSRAREYGAQVMPSSRFAPLIENSLRGEPAPEKPDVQTGLDEAEMEYWMNVFGEDD